MSRLRRLLLDQRGVETTEWLGVGAMLVLMIVAIYGVLEGNIPLRTAVANTVSSLAVNFGQDMVVRGPTIPEMPLQTELGTLSVSLDPESGRYVAFDPETGRSYEVLPSSTAQVSVDEGQGLVSVGDPTQHITALINPTSGGVVLIDHDSGVRRQVQIEDLEDLGMVTIR